MGRPPKDYVRRQIKLRRNINDRLIAEVQRTGQDATAIVEEALDKALPKIEAEPLPA